MVVGLAQWINHYFNLIIIIYHLSLLCLILQILEYWAGRGMLQILYAFAFFIQFVN